MNIDVLLTTCCGFEDGQDGQIRFFLDGPNPEPSLKRERPARTDLFHLFGGDEAQAIRDYLARHRCWDVMRVPPDYTRDRGTAAIRTAARWHSGRHSPLYLFAADRRIHDEERRGQLRRATQFLIASVLEKSVHDHDYPDLDLLRQVIETAPLDTELCTAADVGQ